MQWLGLNGLNSPNAYRGIIDNIKAGRRDHGEICKVYENADVATRKVILETCMGELDSQRQYVTMYLYLMTKEPTFEAIGSAAKWRKCLGPLLDPSAGNMEPLLRRFWQEANDYQRLKLVDLLTRLSYDMDASRLRKYYYDAASETASTSTTTTTTQDMKALLTVACQVLECSHPMNVDFIVRLFMSARSLTFASMNNILRSCLSAVLNPEADPKMRNARDVLYGNLDMKDMEDIGLSDKRVDLLTNMGYRPRVVMTTLLDILNEKGRAWTAAYLDLQLLYQQVDDASRMYLLRDACIKKVSIDFIVNFYLMTDTPTIAEVDDALKASLTTTLKTVFNPNANANKSLIAQLQGVWSLANQMKRKKLIHLLQYMECNATAAHFQASLSNNNSPVGKPAGPGTNGRRVVDRNGNGNGKVNNNSRVNSRVNNISVQKESAVSSLTVEDVVKENNNDVTTTDVVPLNRGFGRGNWFGVQVGRGPKPNNPNRRLLGKKKKSSKAKKT
jgi:hypothetical protein